MNRFFQHLSSTNFTKGFPIAAFGNGDSPCFIPNPKTLMPRGWSRTGRWSKAMWTKGPRRIPKSIHGRCVPGGVVRDAAREGCGINLAAGRDRRPCWKAAAEDCGGRPRAGTPEASLAVAEGRGARRRQKAAAEGWQEAVTEGRSGRRRIGGRLALRSRVPIDGRPFQKTADRRKACFSD